MRKPSSAVHDGMLQMHEERDLQAVVFDIDGTLLHSSAVDEALYNEAVLAVLGPVRLRAGLQDYAHVSDSGILNQILADNRIERTPELVETVQQAFFARIREYIDDAGPFAEVDGARALLARLQQSAAHIVALATGGWRRTAELKLRTAGFDIDDIPLATADDATERTAIMRHALAAHDGHWRAAVYYGDGNWDEAACVALGWEFRPVGAALGGIVSFDGEFAG